MQPGVKCEKHAALLPHHNVDHWQKAGIQKNPCLGPCAQLDSSTACSNIVPAVAHGTGHRFTQSSIALGVASSIAHKYHHRIAATMGRLLVTLG